MTRKLIVIATIGAILVLADLPAVADAMINWGLVGLAERIHARFLSGGSLTIVAVVLFLIPTETPDAARRPCRTCGHPMPRDTQYCPRCGSRTGLQAP